MTCPVCKNYQLVMTDRQGIEIDYCPNCRGVWLDRGELEKIIERSVGEPVMHHEAQRREHNVDDYHKYSRKKKRESFLGDLFDF